MTIQYMDENKKEEYRQKYKKLEKSGWLRGNITEISERKCLVLPDPEKAIGSPSHGGPDDYSIDVIKFEDDDYDYLMIKTELRNVDDEDNPFYIDHSIDIWKSPKHHNTLLVVSGPSGVGKDPIIEWLKKMYCPDLAQVKVKKEQTHGNEKRSSIDDITNRFEFDCRGTRQAIDLDELDNALKDNKIVLLETYHAALDEIIKRYNDKVWIESVFISPLDETEITELGNNIKTYLPELMEESLKIRTTMLENTKLTDEVHDKIKKRALDSVNEINIRGKYKYIIPNHCFESDKRWRMPILVGEPKHVVDSLYDIIKKHEVFK